MADKTPIPLVGRLAIQLKMLTSVEVERAMAESVSSGNPRLAQVFVQMGLLDRDQIAKIQEVQKDLVEKHRAKNGGPAAAPAPARASTPTSTPNSQSKTVHKAAEHAAAMAAPVTSKVVEDLRVSGSRPAGKPEAKSRSLPPSVVGPAVGPAKEDSPQAAVAPPAPPAAPPPRPPVPSQPAVSADAPPVSAVRGSSGRVSLDLNVPEPTADDRKQLEAILSAGVSQKASDVHFHTGGPIKQRRNGELVVVEESIAPEQVERIVSAALTPEQRQVLRDDGEIDFCFDVSGVGRFRANAYRQQRGLDAVFRIVSERPPTLEELGLPEALKKYTDYHQGMVLITGPAGCGKSSTLAALVNHINENRDDHILTIEDPIEIIHPSKRCLVNQRHAGHHTASFSRALRGALREDPDIIVIGELRDLETISLAMTAAETGHFVLATLHTANAVRTVNRMIGAFPSNEQDQVRAMLSESLRAVISQRLVPTADGNSRVPALELLVINRAIGNLIRDEKTVQIRSSMQTGKSHGMYLLEQSLNELVAAGKITRETALMYAEEKKLITAGA